MRGQENTFSNLSYHAGAAISTGLRPRIIAWALKKLMQSTHIYRASGVAGYQVNQYPVLSQCFARSLYNGHFFSKKQWCICKHFVNKLPPPAVRRCNSFCFYGIAAAMGLRHANGNIGVTISNIRPECFSFSLPLLQFQKRFLTSFQKIVLQDEKRTVCIANRS